MDVVGDQDRRADMGARHDRVFVVAADTVGVRRGERPVVGGDTCAPGEQCDKDHRRRLATTCGVMIDPEAESRMLQQVIDDPDVRHVISPEVRGTSRRVDSERRVMDARAVAVSRVPGP